MGAQGFQASCARAVRCPTSMPYVMQGLMKVEMHNSLSTTQLAVGQDVLAAWKAACGLAWPHALVVLSTTGHR
jgi:hypothetical protein